MIDEKEKTTVQDVSEVFTGTLTTEEFLNY